MLVRIADDDDGPIVSQERQADGAPAAKRRRRALDNEWWLADTCCGYDMLSATKAMPLVDSTLDSDVVPSFHTANGVTSSSRQVDAWIPELDQYARPHVLEPTPSV